MKRNFILLTFLMSITYFPAFASTYYVDAIIGNDLNSGLAPSQAWKTIRKINFGIFNPGDQILLKSGQKWREQLNFPSSGSPGSPIIIGSYDSGEKPILSGADIISGFVQHSSYVWKIIMPYPQQIFYNEIRGFEQTALNFVNADKEWYYDSTLSTLYLYSIGNPSVTYNSPGIEIPARQYCIYVLEDYLTIQNLQLEKTYNSEIKITPFAQNIIVDGITFLQWSVEQNWEFDGDDIHGIGGIDIYGNNCEVKNSTFGRNTGNDIADQNWSGFLGIHVYAVNTKIHHNNIYHNGFENEIRLGNKSYGIRLTFAGGVTEVYNNYIYHTAGHGILVRSNTNLGDTIKVYDNRIDYTGQAGISAYKTRREDGIGGTGLIFGNHVSFSNRLGGQWGSGGTQSSGIHLNDGVVKNTDAERPFMKWYVFDNVVHNTQAINSPNSRDSDGIALDYNANDVEVYRNLIYDNWGKGVYLWNVNRCKIYYNIIYGNDTGSTITAATGTSETADYNQVFNNTYYKNYNTDARGPNYDTEIYFGGNGNYNIIKNNILYGHDEGVIYYFRDQNTTGCITDNNIVYKDGGHYAWDSYKGYQSFDQWRTNHPDWDNNSINTDPLFIAAANGNFNLSSTSPAINSGIDLGFTTDFYNRNLFETPDIGAIEYGSTANVDSLTLVTAMTDNANTLRVFFSKEVQHSTALNKNNYSISNGINVTGIILTGSKHEVILTTTDHVEEQLYVITVTNVFDLIGVPISSEKNRYEYNYFSGTIPVELVSFTSSVVKDKVELYWATASETNNAGFEIQKSLNNENVWVKIRYIPGKGNSVEPVFYRFTDDTPGTGEVYYRLKQINFDGTFNFSEVINLSLKPSLTFSLNQNYPNPFNPSTIINFSIPKKSRVLLAVYDMLGKHITNIIDEERDAGNYKVNFNADELSSGIYFYVMRADNLEQTRKMILLR